MTEAFLIIALLGLGWALASGFVLQGRLRAVESTLARERAETAARLEALEGLAHDRWLAESASLGGQVAAMIQALEESAARAHGEIAERGARLEALLRQADARLGAPAAPPAARPRETRADRVPASQTQVARAQSTPRQREVARLAAAGYTPAEIAHHIRLSIAEVELMLRLVRPPAAPADREALQQTA